MSINIKFYNGYKVRIETGFGAESKQKLVTVINDLRTANRQRPGDSIVVNSEDIEPICDTMFSIGDEVTSILEIPPSSNRTNFMGVVTGFEYDTNRVICKSTKESVPEDTRQRYAYRIDEIIKANRAEKLQFEFKPGMLYMINNTTKVMAVDSLFNPEEVMLFGHNDGAILWRDIPKKAFLPSLKVYKNIYNVQQIKNHD